MTITAPVQPARDANPPPLRLETLVRLRWLAIGGQTLGVLFVALMLGFPMPLVACLALIALSALLNLWLVVRFEAGRRLSTRFAAAQLAYDCVQLAALLGLTGGLQNPFSLLLLAPVSVSATTLPARATFVLAALAVALATILSVVHFPLPWMPGETLVLDRVYIVGIWVSLVCGVVFIAAYTNRVAHESRQLANALAATELALSRHEQLSALDGLAAAAAHELGTPLSTIALAAKEMRADVPPGPLADDVDLIISQSDRCRAILAKLRNLGSEGGDPFATVPLPELLAEVVQPYRAAGKTIEITEAGTGDAPIIRRSVSLLYGLGNLIENAADFARTQVRITAAWDRATVRLTIADDGPGFSPEVIARLGEPYLTTRSRENGGESAAGGLGLGIFIAKTLLERTGARIAFDNAASEGQARVRIAWPRDRIESA